MKYSWWSPKASLIFIVSTFVALSLYQSNFESAVVKAHKTIADDEDEMAGEEGSMPGDAIIDDMGEEVQENG